MKRIVLPLALVLGCSAAAAADKYTIDSSHTFPSFEVSHMGFSTFRGRFDKTTGDITLDKAAKTGSVNVTIDAASVSTGVAKLDEHIRTGDFLDVEKHPTITFKSSSFKFKGDTPVSVNGDLTIRGVTKPVTLKVNSLVCKDHPMRKKPACGADLETTIKRSDFGVSYGVPGVGDEVKIRIGVEAGS